MTEGSRTAEGYVVDAGLLGRAFGIDPALVPELMRSGAITGHHERGVGPDEGRHCLAFVHADRTLRITLDEAGRIISQSMYRPIITPRAGKRQEP